MLERFFVRRRFAYPAAALITLQVLPWQGARAEAPPQLAQAGEKRLTVAEASAKLDALFGLVADRRNAIDEAAFDPAALARRLGPRVADAFAFVRDRIGYEAYRGTLRFAEGALMSRAANGCDRSLLLAALLRAHGHKVRFARAEIAEAQALALIRQTVSKREPAPFDGAALIADFARLGAPNVDAEKLRASMDRARMRAMATMRTAAAADGEQVIDALKAANLTVADAKAAPDAVIVAAARDHCWVQIEDRSAWLDLDPSAKTHNPGDRFAAPSWTGDALPAALAHRLRIVVSIERNEGKVSKADILLDHAAVLDRAVTAVSLAFVPENAARTAPVAAPDVAGLTSFTAAWPVLDIDGARHSGSPFDLVTGTKLPPRPPAGLGGPWQRPGGTLDGVLGGPKAPPASFARLILSIEVTAPDGTVRRAARDYARAAGGPTGEAVAALRARLLGQWGMVATASRVDPSFFAARYLDAWRASEKALRELIAQRHGAPDDPAKIAAAAPPSRFPLEALAFHLSRADTAERFLAETAPAVRRYAAEPQLVAFRTAASAPGAAAALEMQFDIVANRMRVVDEDPARAAPPLLSARLGSLDTQLEYRLLGGGQAVNAHTVLAAAKEAGTALIALAPSARGALAGLPVDDATRAMIAADLDRGYAVVAPTKRVALAGKNVFAWYRIDLASGETLGVGETGEGQALLENLIRLAAVWALTVYSTCLYIIKVAPPGSYDRDQYATRCGAIAFAPLGSLIAVVILIEAWHIVLAFALFGYALNKFDIAERVSGYVDR